MDKPEVSPDFTIEDIHRIREYNYEVTKNMSVNERRQYYNSKAEKMRAEITKLKETRQVKACPN